MPGGVQIGLLFQVPHYQKVNDGVDRPPLRATGWKTPVAAAQVVEGATAHVQNSGKLGKS